MTTPLAAQNTCPTRADLATGIQLIDTTRQEAHLFRTIGFDGMITHDPIDANGRVIGFEDVPDFMGLTSPHPVFPILRISAKGSLMITYYGNETDLDHMWSDPKFEKMAADQLDVGETVALNVAMSRMVSFLGFQRTRNAGDGTVEVVYLGPSPHSPHSLRHCQYDLVTYRVTQRMSRDETLYEDAHYAPTLGLVLGRTRLDAQGVAETSHWFGDFKTPD